MNNLADQQTKLIIERINQTEKNHSELCEKFANLARKLSRVRDKNDDLAKSLKSVADSEKTNSSLEKSLTNLSQAIVLIADCQDLEVKRIEEKVVLELAQYSEICKNATEEVKSQVLLRDKEFAKRKQLDASRPKNRRLKNETEVLKSNIEINKVLKEIQEISDSFEKQKYDDLKSILTNFILIQLKSHSTALELLTAAYSDINNMDEKSDLQQFKKMLQQQEDPPQGYFLSRFRSQSMGALSSMFSNTKEQPKDELLQQRRHLKNYSQNSVSLHSLDSDTEEIRKESKPIVLSGDSIEIKTSESEEESLDEDAMSKTSETTESETQLSNINKNSTQVHQTKKFK